MNSTAAYIVTMFSTRTDAYSFVGLRLLIFLPGDTIKAACGSKVPRTFDPQLREIGGLAECF